MNIVVKDLEWANNVLVIVFFFFFACVFSNFYFSYVGNFVLIPYSWEFCVNSLQLPSMWCQGLGILDKVYNIFKAIDLKGISSKIPITALDCTSP